MYDINPRFRKVLQPQISMQAQDPLIDHLSSPHPALVSSAHKESTNRTHSPLPGLLSSLLTPNKSRTKTQKSEGILSLGRSIAEDIDSLYQVIRRSKSRNRVFCCFWPRGLSATRCFSLDQKILFLAEVIKFWNPEYMGN